MLGTASSFLQDCVPQRERQPAPAAVRTARRKARPCGRGIRSGPVVLVGALNAVSPRDREWSHNQPEKHPGQDVVESAVEIQRRLEEKPNTGVDDCKSNQEKNEVPRENSPGSGHNRFTEPISQLK